MNAFDLLCMLLQPMTWFALIAFGVWMQRDHVAARRQLDELTARLAQLTRLVEAPTWSNSSVRVDEDRSPTTTNEEPQPLPTARARYRAS